MPSIKSILTNIQTLPLNQVEELLSYLEEFLVSNSQVEQKLLICQENLIKEGNLLKREVYLKSKYV